MIAIVYPLFYSMSGIERYLDSFLFNLPKNSSKIYVITGDENKVERNYKGVEIIHFLSKINRFNLFIWGLKARQIMQRLFAEAKIKAINLHFPPTIPTLLFLKNIPILLTVGSTYLGMLNQFYPKKYYTSYQYSHSVNLSYAEHEGNNIAISTFAVWEVLVLKLSLLLARSS